MEKIMEIEHNEPFDELRHKLIKKVESLRNRYSQEIDSYNVRYLWNKERDVLIITCDRYNINWCVIVFPNIIQIYEESPPYIKPFLLDYRDQLKSMVQEGLQEIIN